MQDIGEAQLLADDEPQQASATGDPIVRRLTGIMLLVLIVFLTAALSLVLYVLSMRDAPRTAVEREMATDEAAVREQPAGVDNWARLALSYAHAERWDDALATIDRGRQVKKAAILDLTEADILRLKGDPRMMAAYDRALASAQAEYASDLQTLKEKKGVGVKLPDDLVFEAMAGRARALAIAGRTAEAIDQARAALASDPSDADLHVALAGWYAKAGRTKDAANEYRAALSYVPDLKAALDGLKKLGEVKTGAR